MLHRVAYESISLLFVRQNARIVNLMVSVQGKNRAHNRVRRSQAFVIKRFKLNRKSYKIKRIFNAYYLGFRIFVLKASFKEKICYCGLYTLLQNSLAIAGTYKIICMSG